MSMHLHINKIFDSFASNKINIEAGIIRTGVILASFLFLLYNNCIQKEVLRIMSEYSKQFIEEIVTQHLDPKILTFFKRRKVIDKYPESTIEELVKNVLNEYYEGNVAAQDLIPIIDKIKHSRIKKRTRWVNSILNDAETIPLSSPEHPFFIAVSSVDLDSDLSVDEIISDCKQKVLNWKKNNQLLIEFPYLNRFTANSIYKSFKNDIIYEISIYIGDKLNYNINAYYKKYPTELIEKPLFSPSSFIYANNTSSNILKEIITDDNNKELLSVEIDTGKLIMPRAMTAEESKLINIFISNIKMKTFASDATVTIGLYDILKEWVSFKAGSTRVDKLEASCKKLVEYNYSYIQGPNKVYFNLFDSIVIRRNVSSPYISVTFGKMLFEAIMEQKLISITSSSYDLLDNALSKIICYALKKEQIANQETLCKTYNYVYFQSIVHFKLKNKKKNIKLICESLDDFVVNRIIIKKYELVDDDFTLFFYQLTDAEIEDLYSNPHKDNS